MYSGEQAVEHPATSNTVSEKESTDLLNVCKLVFDSQIQLRMQSNGMLSHAHSALRKTQGGEPVDPHKVLSK